MRTKSDTLLIPDLHNTAKVWRIRRYRSGNYFVNQLINGAQYYSADRRMTAANIMEAIPGAASYWVAQ